MTEVTEEPQLEVPKSPVEQANYAFAVVVEAIDLALRGQLPLGIDHIELHVKIKKHLREVSEILNAQFPQPEEAETQNV